MHERSVLQSDHEDVSSPSWKEICQVPALPACLGGESNCGGRVGALPLPLVGKAVDATAFRADEEPARGHCEAPRGTVDLCFPNLFPRRIKGGHGMIAAREGDLACDHRDVRKLLDGRSRSRCVGFRLAVFGDRGKGATLRGPSGRSHHLALAFGEISLRAQGYRFLRHHLSCS